MKILWLSWKDITHPDAGGAEISGEQHAIAWVKAGHSVQWVSVAYKGSEKRTEKDGVIYEHLGKKWMWFFGFIHILFWFKWVTKWHKQFDVIVDEIHGPPLLTPLYARKPVLVIIHEVAGDIWKKTVPFPVSWIMQNLIEPLFFKAYKTVPVIAGAESTIEDLINIGIPEKNITFIPYGVTIAELKQQFTKETTPTLIFLSQLRPMKGFDRVYEAFKKIKTKIPSIHLWIVGDDSLPYGVEMKEKVKNENQLSHITFWGKVSQEKKFELLQRAHIIVHGSYKEGWGLVVIEANAVGTPAVVFDAAGLRNSVNHGVSGFVAKNEEEFIRDVIMLFESKDKYAEMQKAAQLWSNRFSWKNATEKSLSLLSSL